MAVATWWVCPREVYRHPLGLRRRFESSSFNLDVAHWTQRFGESGTILVGFLKLRGAW
jgi:hypothetical protein